MYTVDLGENENCKRVLIEAHDFREHTDIHTRPRVHANLPGISVGRIV
jgi:hypothetical protein